MNAWNLGQMGVQYPGSIHRNADAERKYFKHEIRYFLSFLISPMEMVVYYLFNSCILRTIWVDR